jgi:lysophospholipase L1-like esterase
MEHLPYDLDFMHKYNLHKWMGYDIDDNDLKFISAIYGVRYKDLRRVEDVFVKNIEKGVSEIAGLVQEEPPQKPYTIAAVGDSISSDRQSWVKILNILWKGQRRIVDCAISGDTTSDLIDRFYGTIMNEDFQWAVLFIGTNDCRELDDGSHMTQIGFDEYKLKMNYIMERFLQAGKQVVNVTLPPVDTVRLKNEFPDNAWTYDAERIRKTNDFIRQLSKRSKSRLADLAEAVAAHDGDVLEKDGLHLNAEGQVILCKLLLEELP